MTRWLAACVSVLTLSCAAPCVPGETAPCTCSDGLASARICRASGQFDRCACRPAADGGTDAGLDAGPDPACRNNQPPWLRTIGPLAAHLPTGEVEVAPPLFEDPERDALTFTSQVFEGADGGPLGPPQRLDGGSLRVTLPTAGEYRLEVHAADACNDTAWKLRVTAVSGRRLPFAVTAGLCCDEAQRPWVVAAHPPRLIRLEADGGWDTLALLARKPTSLSLSLDAGVLAVAQDSRVSFFRVGQAVPWVADLTTLVDHEPSLVVLGDRAAWTFGDYAAQGIDLDGGSTSALDFGVRAMRAEQGALTPDGRFVVVNTQSRGVERLFVSGSQLLVLPSTGSSTQSCGGLWSSADHAHFFTGCGEVLAVGDGGFTHAGTLPEGRGTLVGLGDDGRGSLVAAFLPTMAGRDQTVLWVDARTFALTGSLARELNGAALEQRLLPAFVFLDAEGAANVLTVLDEPSSTWWEVLK